MPNLNKKTLPEFGTDLYHPDRLQALFNEMSATYGRVNVVASFGFSRRWRKQCVNLLKLRPAERVLDLMSGMGECLEFIVPDIGDSGYVLCVDFSSQMVRRAIQQRDQTFIKTNCEIEIRQADIFCLADDLTLKDSEKFDAVVCGYGLKTLQSKQYELLAMLLARILKPGGRFAMLEISTPPFIWLRWPYMVYLRHVIPILGKLFLGNPENYRMLGYFTEHFNNCKEIQTSLEKTGLQDVRMHSFFMGCATALTGRVSGHSII